MLVHVPTVLALAGACMPASMVPEPVRLRGTDSGAPGSTCGDGFVLDGVEECDDGNRLGGDGCTPHCRRPRVLGVEDASAIVRGDTPWDRDTLLANGGDLDGDGFDDLLIAELGNERIVVVAGPLAGSIVAGPAMPSVTLGYPGRIDRVEQGGDFDRDGFADVLVVGRPAASSLEHRVHLLFGPIVGIATVGDLGPTLAGDRITGTGALGDVDGDGSDDLIVGVGVRLENGTPVPASARVFTRLDRRGSLHLDATTATHGGDFEVDVGGAFASGELDGSPGRDVVVTDPTYGSDAEGALFVVSDPAVPSTIPDTPTRIVGAPGDRLGDVVLTGDLDGDGFDDLVTRGSLLNEAGSIDVYYGPLRAGRLTRSDASVVVHPEPSAGATLRESSVGDVNGDGVDDLVVGANLLVGADLRAGGSSAAARGAVYVFLGPLASSVSAAEADIVIRGTPEHSNLGLGLAVGHFDDDELADVVVGSNSSILVFAGAGF